MTTKFESLPTGYTHKVIRNGEYKQGQYASYLVILVTPNGDEKHLAGYDDCPLSFASEPEKKYTLGDVRDTLVREFIGNDEEAWCYHKHGYGLRTKKYLDACKNQMEFVGRSCDETLTINKDWTVFNAGDVKTSDLYITSTDSGYRVAFQIGVGDGVYEHRYDFNRRPSMQNVRDAIAIEKAERDFRLFKLQEAFTCWECGCPVEHWLDTPGNLTQKLEQLYNKYCGC